jgi:flavin reductase (DIM6/NTAB) family NADH-FMN oxidoreductase RutF
MSTPDDANWAQIEAVFKLVRRPVWIVTAATGQARGGLLATFVVQSSIDPESPTVMVGLAPNHFTAELVEKSGGFALHLLRSDQQQLAWRFALASGRVEDKLAGLATKIGASGSPILSDCLAWLDCRVCDRHDGGDRWYFWADVVAGNRLGTASPLDDATLIASADDTQKKQLVADLQADRLLQREMRAAWRKKCIPTEE